MSGTRWCPKFGNLLGDEAGIERFTVDDLEGPRARPQVHVTTTGLGAACAKRRKPTCVNGQAMSAHASTTLVACPCRTLPAVVAVNVRRRAPDRTGRSAASDRVFRHRHALGALVASVVEMYVAARRSRHVGVPARRDHLHLTEGSCAPPAAERRRWRVVPRSPSSPSMTARSGDARSASSSSSSPPRLSGTQRAAVSTARGAGLRSSPVRSPPPSGPASRGLTSRRPG